MFYLYVNKYVDFFFTSNCQCSLFSNKNPIIRIFYISEHFSVPINPGNWSSTVFRKSHFPFHPVCPILQPNSKVRLKKKIPYDIPWMSIWCMTNNKAPSSTPVHFTSIPQARMSDKAAHGETHSLSSLHAASDVMIPGGRSSVINSVASRTQTPCRAHSNEWGSSVPSPGIATFSGSHSFRNDKKSFFVLFRNIPL